jgi:hypothetical protein
MVVEQEYLERSNMCAQVSALPGKGCCNTGSSHLEIAIISCAVRSTSKRTWSDVQALSLIGAVISCIPEVPEIHRSWST